MLPARGVVLEHHPASLLLCVKTDSPSAHKRSVDVGEAGDAGDACGGAVAAVAIALATHYW